MCPSQNNFLDLPLTDTMTCGANLAHSTSRQVAAISDFFNAAKLHYCLLGSRKHLIGKGNPLGGFYRETGIHLFS